MFKRLKGSIAKNDESKPSNSVPQNRQTYSGFSTISPLNSEMENSQFCIDDEIEETPKNSPARVAVSESTTIDLGQFSQSSSSLTNDHSFHTDIESASELDDNVSVVSEYANEITKENLYAAYKKLHGRYHKHKIKYTELTNKFQQTVAIHDKDKITMTKAQDKLLRRITELKEQSALEQAAKTHLEEALRNDVEERDHIISTLNTKIDLLKKNSSDEGESTTSTEFVDLLAKCDKLTEDLSSTKSKCESLEKQIELLKISEESTLLSLAENKMAIHKELETKEDQIKKLEKTINGLQMENKVLLKEKASHSSTNSYQVNINQNVQEEITKQLSELEGEMSSAFESKENEVKELKNQLKILEHLVESQKHNNISKEETLKAKDKDIKEYIQAILRVEEELIDLKASHSVEIKRKNDTVEYLSGQISEDHTRFKKEILDLKNQIVQNKKVIKENELIRLDEQNKCIQELKLKSEEITNLKEELQLLQCTITEKEKNILDLQNHVDDLSLKNNDFIKSVEELKLKINDYSKLNEELQKNITMLQEEKETMANNLKVKSNKNNLEFDKLQSEEITNLKEELQLVQCTVSEKEKNILELKHYVDEINLKNNNFIESEEELKQKINDFSISNEKLQNTIQMLQEEKETLNKTLKIKMEENNLEFDEQKSKEIASLKEELQLVKSTITKKEKNILDLKHYVDEITLKNINFIKSEEELKQKINDFSKSNEKLQTTIQMLQEEKETVTKTMKVKLEESQVEFDKLNQMHKAILSQLNQDKLNKLSEERSIESVIKDYNLLTEENAYLKKERQKMHKLFQDMLNKFKIDFENLKVFTQKQLVEWSLIFVKQIKQLKAEYSLQIKLHHNKLAKSKKKLELVLNAFSTLKSDCTQSLEYFKVEIIEKYNGEIINQMSHYTDELEKRKIDLLRLHEEIDNYRKSEERSVNAEVKETIQELQECIEVQKQTFTDLQNEYSNFQVTEKKKWTDKLIETENKWLEKMDNYKKMMDSEHREEVEALTNEWANERKRNVNLETAECKSKEALEKIIQDVETTSQREEGLQRQITKLNKELSELKKMYRNEVHNKSSNDAGGDDNDKDGCEMEYLRNILYEYMMGKQPMVLVKVLAAIVKFDSNQLNSVLQKEEQKISLLKTLGL